MKSNLKNIFQYVKRFHYNSIFIRNLILITLSMIMLLIAISGAFCYNMQKAAYNEISMVSRESVRTIRSVTDSVLHTTDILAVQTSLNSNVQKLFLSFPGSEYSITETYRKVREYIGGYTNIYPYISSIYIYSEPLGIVINNQELSSFNNFGDIGWHSYYQSSNSGDAIIVSRKMNDRYPYFISMIRPVIIEDIGKVGCVVINIDAEELNMLLNDIDDRNLNDVIIFDKSGLIMGCTDSAQIGNNIDDYLHTDEHRSLKDFGNVTLNSQKYMYASLNSAQYDISYLLLIPKTFFNNVTIRSVAFILLILLLIITAGFVISFVISVKTYNPIQDIINVLLPVQSIDSDNFNELSYITDTIKSTLDKAHSLAEDLNLRMVLLKEAQAYALQSQINPHFLNNTLEAMNWTAISKLGEKNTISEMIKALSMLLDISLNNEHYLITIEKELQHTNIYLYIISLNYSSDLNFKWEIDEEISKYKIIKLSLQPIIENAVNHGILPKNGKGEITIKGSFKDDGILITISDNGVGMTENEISELQSGLDSNILTGKCIGLKNVNQRIKLIFGEKYGIHIDSKIGHGTTVSLFIPTVK